MRAIFKVLPLLAGLIIATGCSEDPTQPKETVAPTIASDSWEFAIGGSAYDRTYGVAVDYLGNVFIAGSFFNTIDLGGETLDAAAGRAFIAKYDPDGELIWASQISGNSGNPLHVSTDGAGNLVVTGLFLGDLTLGPVTLSNAIGRVHVFIVKYSAAGDVMWTDHDPPDTCRTDWIPPPMATA